MMEMPLMIADFRVYNNMLNYIDNRFINNVIIVLQITW